LSTVAVVVVTNSRSLLEYLQTVDDGAVDVELSRDFGETRITGQSLLTTPRWDWGNADTKHSAARAVRLARAANIGTGLMLIYLAGNSPGSAQRLGLRRRREWAFLWISLVTCRSGAAVRALPGPRRANADTPASPPPSQR
jgi:hypothetical protein